MMKNIKRIHQDKDSIGNDRQCFVSMSKQSSVEQLCSQLEKKLTVTDAEEYTRALEEILGVSASKGVVAAISPDKVEEVITRSYQDHSESRTVLISQVLRDIPNALNVFEGLSQRTAPILVDCFSDSKSTFLLLEELQRRIHYGEDVHTKYLLSVTLQLLNKFEYDFAKIAFLVDELSLRAEEKEIRSLMLVIFSLLEKKYGAQFNNRFLTKVNSLIMQSQADIGNEPLSLLVDILTELYPVLTALCSEVFLGEQLVHEFKRKVLSQDDEDFIKRLLNLFSIACIDETVRVYIAEQYVPLLKQSLKIKQYVVPSALVLIKTWSFAKLQDITIEGLADILLQVLINPKTSGIEELSACIEGLAYLSLKISVKKMLRQNAEFCNRLLALVKSKKLDSDSYGALVILANLSSFPDDREGFSSFEPKAMRELKAYSDLKNPSNSENENGSKETKEEVAKFNMDHILGSQVLSTLCSEFGSLSHGSKQQVIRLAYNVTRDRGSIHECIKQGCITFVLEYLVNKHNSSDIVKLLAARALTKMLIYTNPSLIFNKYSPVNAVGPLFDLIPRPDVEINEDSFDSDLITVADTYEALLALTNLASLDGAQGEDLCGRIAATEEYWSAIENLMLDDNPVLQRSTLELLSNLMSHPLPIAAKFFNFENPRSLKNFNILVKLLHLQDLQSQRAVAAIFANIASSIPFIALELSSRKELIDRMIDLFQEQLEDKELTQRLIIFFYALLDDSAKESYLLANEKLARALEQAQELPETDPEFSQMISAILEICKR